jgi:CheY-like chemotaxis protein
VSVKSGGAGRGTTFTVRLPLAEVALNPEAMATSSDRSRSRSLQGARILVVDDVADARDLMRAALESAGAAVTLASSAAEAVAATSNGTFDLVLADIGMPDQDGYTLIKVLRRQCPEGVVDVPAVAVSAYARIADRQRALMAGFDRHIAKPVEPERLIESIADVLTIGRTARSSRPIAIQPPSS